MRRGGALHDSLKWSAAILALTLALTAPPALAAETPPKPDHLTLRPDPNVRRGVLPNGMRYQILRNATPKDAVSLRFAIDVGSYEEADAERGWAHFVEHMAFRSTRAFPDGGIDRALAQAGVAFGRDQNAATTLFSTVYQLDLPKADDSQLANAFAWLRDIGDGIVFTEDAVNHERGVVLAEMETRNNAMVAAQEAIGVFQLAGQRSANRSPIGLRTTLNAATASGLEQFYRAWYRPSNAVLTVVGDRPVEVLEAIVRERFSDWRAQGAARERAPLTPPSGDRPMEAFTVSGATLPTAISACRVRPAPPKGPDDVARLRRVMKTQIWQEVLNKRIERGITRGDLKLLGAAAMINETRAFAAVCLVTMPIDEAWPEALKATQSELNSFAASGPTEAEMESATELLRSRLRGAMLSASSRASPDLATGLSARAIADEVFTTPADALYAYDLAVEDLTPADVKAAFDADWSGAPPLLAMTSPKPVAREVLLAAWSQGGAAVAEARKPTAAKDVWTYSSFGKPGKVVDQKLIEPPGFQRLTFSNGLVVNFKQTKFAPNKVEIRVHFGVGQREVDKRDYLFAQFGQMLLAGGGLGRHRISELQPLFQTTDSLNFSMGMGPETFAIRASTFSTNLEEQLQVLTAYMTDPGFDPLVDGRIPASVDLVFRTYLTQPAAAAGVALVNAVAPDSTAALPPREVMMAMRSADFARVLKPILATAPIELTIVGDIDQATAVRAVAATFGAIPARAKSPRAHGDPGFLRYPDRPPETIRVEHSGPADKAAAVLVWPLYVSTPERRREEYAIKLVASVFDNALRQRIREEMGKTYSPNVMSTGPDFGDQGALTVSIEAAPRDLESLVAEARAIAARLAAGEVTPVMLEAARRPLLANVDAVRETNDWWAGAMGGSANTPAVLREALDYEPLMSALTVEDLKAAAAKWLSRPPIVSMAYPGDAATGASQ